MKIKQLIAGLGLGVFALTIVAQPVSAVGTTVVVRPSDTQGWTTADTRTNGTVSFVADADAPLGSGALSLVTGAGGTSQDKAQYMHADSSDLADVTDLSYYTKQNSASFAAGLPSYQLAIDTDGTTGDGLGFTTLVYEPYNNFGNAAVQNGAWQQWDAAAGTFWSSRNVAAENANGGLVAGAGGAPFYSLSDVKAKYPNAVVVGYGVNIGSNNPFYDTLVDGLVFNETTYDFEQNLPLSPTNKNECKNNGWKNFQTPYKNQGQCVSAFERSTH